MYPVSGGITIHPPCEIQCRDNITTLSLLKTFFLRNPRDIFFPEWLHGTIWKKGRKNYDYWFGNWTLLSLNRPGALRRVWEEVLRYRLRITALQEVKEATFWIQKHIPLFGWRRTKIFWHCLFFLEEKRWKLIILDFRPIDDDRDVRRVIYKPSGANPSGEKKVVLFSQNSLH